MMDAEQKLIDFIGLNLRRKHVVIRGCRVHYIVAGSGPPLLLLHGANIGWGAWYPNLGVLTKQFTVYALDLPGSGKSTRMEFRTCDLENDFVEIVEQFIALHQLQNLTIMGHSLGGWVALKLALRNVGIKNLILVSSLGLSDYIPWTYKALAFYPFAKLLSRTVMKPTKMNMKNFLQGVMAKSSGLIDEFVEYFHENVSREKNSHPFFLLQRIFGTFKLRGELVLLNHLHKILCPVLVIAGDRDPLIPIASVKKAIPLFPQAKLEIFSSTGHVPSLEKSLWFNEKVLNFLQ